MPGQPPYHQMLTTLLQDMPLYPEYVRHHNGEGQPPLYLGLLDACKTDHCSAASARGQH